MKLVLVQFLTPDGVCQGPGGPDEDRSDGFTRGGRLTPFVDEAFLGAVAAWVGAADAVLFGRRTYEAFARDWPRATDPGDPVARSLNGLPTYVASRSLGRADWAPATILSGDVADEVAELKRQPGRELQIHGSARLGQALLATGLVDEIRLAVAPVLLGAGRRLFAEGADPSGWRVLRSETTPGGLALQTFAGAGRPSFGTYDVA